MVGGRGTRRGAQVGCGNCGLCLEIYSRPTYRVESLQSFGIKQERVSLERWVRTHDICRLLIQRTVCCVFSEYAPETTHGSVLTRTVETPGWITHDLTDVNRAL